MNGRLCFKVAAATALRKRSGGEVADRRKGFNGEKGEKIGITDSNFKIVLILGFKRG